MLGLLVEIVLSILFLWLVQKAPVWVLGITPNRERLQQLLAGLLIALALCAIFHLSRAWITNNHWVWVPQKGLVPLLSATWWVMRSVLYEELIFRGALLYIASKRLGNRNAILISTIAFGIYHWFSYGVLGNPLGMIIVFLITACAGWMYAYAFMKTQSMYLPIGLHFGWNFVSTIVFSQGPIGNQLFVSQHPITNENSSLMLFVGIMLYQAIAAPLVTWWYLQKTTRPAGIQIKEPV